MILIALSGKKGSGKDTTADIIKKQLEPTTVSKIGFADALYEELAVMLWPETKHNAIHIKEQVEHIKKHKPSFRLLLQGLGTYKRETISKDYWIEAFLRRCLKDTTDGIVVNDCRYLNEVGYLKEIGYLIVRIVSSRIVGNDTHESETALDTYGKFDYVITNDGSIEDLENQVKIFLAKLLRNK